MSGDDGNSFDHANGSDHSHGHDHDHCDNRRRACPRRLQELLRSHRVPYRSETCVCVAEKDCETRNRTNGRLRGGIVSLGIVFKLLGSSGLTHVSHHDDEISAVDSHHADSILRRRSRDQARP
jgi:hypothetical protein